MVVGTSKGRQEIDMNAKPRTAGAKKRWLLAMMANKGEHPCWRLIVLPIMQDAQRKMLTWPQPMVPRANPTPNGPSISVAITAPIREQWSIQAWF